jgi:hypothetical protein
MPFRVVHNGRQIDAVYFAAPGGEARQKKARSCPRIEGAIALSRWHQIKGDIDASPKEPAYQEISLKVCPSTIHPKYLSRVICATVGHVLTTFSSIFVVSVKSFWLANQAEVI